eukprot:5048206-Pleurochrysis_carterae.AAC.4
MCEPPRWQRKRFSESTRSTVASSPQRTTMRTRPTRCAVTCACTSFAQSSRAGSNLIARA